MVARAPDRSFRSLSGLERTASTSRVLNLAAVASQNVGDPEYEASPFFRAAALNGAVIIKHRIRNDEQYIFEQAKRISTKVIIPFERTDLSLGGRSLFVGQRGWQELLNQLRGSQEDEARDVALLEALDELPSLDPFLLREHLKRRDFKIANCYFAISAPDLERMQRFVSGEISKLVDLAYGGGKTTGAPNANISKLVSLLLSGQDDARLEPLRLTLGLEGENFREGIFSWKGFLYYKWVLNSLWPELRGVISELTEIKVVGPRDYEMMSQVKEVGGRVNQAILGQVRKVRSTLQVYDDAFAELTQAGNPMAFRNFLLKSPEMFITLGERTGMVSHIASFWRYRFPKGRPLKVELDELFDILQDFHQGLGEDEDKTAPAAVVGDSALIDPVTTEPIGKAV
ncbi:MAG TPA: hypothetical protein VFE18_14975 [Phenylobacterium sp.]|uniref:hypothetical protein n=1 Tax=Phenylobacterium sp. TaxID=1871053 RepID=UPI002D39AD19|nr:hypothetical protein [Phenylobacterium sp.]HZZ69473.1 hypothetical protein [Phenylobacterium sp.]